MTTHVNTPEKAHNYLNS